MACGRPGGASDGDEARDVITSYSIHYTKLYDAKKGRTLISPVLKEISSLPGTDLEDKGWSIAVHYRNVSPDAGSILGPLLEKVRRRKEIKMFEGPSVAEIQLVPGWEKSRGLASLCRFLRIDPSRITSYNVCYTKLLRFLLLTFSRRGARIDPASGETFR